MVSYVQTFDTDRADGWPMGENPTGLILYTADGYMSAQLGPADRQRFASDIITDGTDAEYAHAARTFIAYSGRFFCDEDAKMVTHQVHVSVFPNWVGTDQLRAVDFEHDLLRLSSKLGAPGSSPGAVQVLTWRRLTWS